MLWPKKNSYKEFDNEKKFLRLENSPPPHKFSNGPSLMVIHHLSARLSLALKLIVLAKLYSEGHCLKVAHFFLKEAKLLLSNAICFSISMKRMTKCTRVP